LLHVPSLAAQDKPGTEAKVPTILKLQVAISEQEGEKKVASLPYVLLMRDAEDIAHSYPWSKVRMGSRVPVSGGKDCEVQYIDVGTNIDARSIAAGDGRYEIALNLERSWVEGEATAAGQKTQGAAADLTPGRQPIIRQFKSELSFTMRDGQTVQATQAADPLSARLLTIAVTLNVVK
jgi:hypothetical protein